MLVRWVTGQRAGSAMMRDYSSCFCVSRCDGCHPAKRDELGLDRSGRQQLVRRFQVSSLAGLTIGLPLQRFCHFLARSSSSFTSAFQLGTIMRLLLYCSSQTSFADEQYLRQPLERVGAQALGTRSGAPRRWATARLATDAAGESRG